MMKRKLSADPSALILGIIGIVIILPGCCCGLVDIVALALCIIGLVLANKSLAEYKSAPEQYDPQSKGNVQAGKVISIIGIVLSGLVILIYAIYFAFWGALLSDAIKQGYNNRNNQYQYQVQDSTDNYQDFDYHDSIPEDTLAVDTTGLKVEKVK